MARMRNAFRATRCCKAALPRRPRSSTSATPAENATLTAALEIPATLSGWPDVASTQLAPGALEAVQMAAPEAAPVASLGCAIQRRAERPADKSSSVMASRTRGWVTRIEYGPFWGNASRISRRDRKERSRGEIERRDRKERSNRGVEM